MAQIGNVATAADKEVKRDWPVVSGIEAIDKHEGRQINLVPEEESLVYEKDKELL